MRSSGGQGYGVSVRTRSTSHLARCVEHRRLEAGAADVDRQRLDVVGPARREAGRGRVCSRHGAHFRWLHGQREDLCSGLGHEHGVLELRGPAASSVTTVQPSAQIS